MSTSEAYTVAANLMFKSNITEGMNPVIESMEKLEKILSRSREDLAKLGQSYDRFASAAVRASERAAKASQEGAEKSARAQEKSAERATRAEDLRATRLEAAERRVTEARQRAARAQEDAMYRMQRAEAEYEDRQRTRASRAQAASQHISAMDVQMAASSAEGTLGRLITTGAHAAMDPAQTQSMLAQDDRVGKAGAQEAYDKTFKVSLDTNTPMAKNMEALLDLKNITGDLKEAQEILPQFAHLSAVLAAADRHHGGSGDPAFAAAKAMESLGLLTKEERNEHTGRLEPKIDAKEIGPIVEAFARVSVATNGRVGPEQYFAFAKQARVGGMQLSHEFLFEKLPAILLNSSSDRTGTAVQSMSQVFQGGRLTMKSLEMLQELGLAGDAHVTGEGQHKRIVGKVYEQDLMGSDPAAYAAKVHDHLVNDLHKTEAEAMNAVQSANQRNTIAGFIAFMMKDQAGILREQQNIQHTDKGGFDDFLKTNPQARLNAFNNSLTNLETALAGPSMEPAIKMMDSMTGALNALGRWSKENPVKAEAIGAVITAGAAIAGALAMVSGAMMIYGPLISAARANLVASGADAAALAAKAASQAAPGASRLSSLLRLGGKFLGPVGLAYGLYESTKDVYNSTRELGQTFNPFAHDNDHFSVFNRQTWADPNSGFMRAAPKPGDMPSLGLHGPQDVRVVNPGDLARAGVSNLARQANRPDAGVGGFDSRGSIQPHVNTGLQ